MIVCSNAKLISLHCPGCNGGRYIGKWNWYKKKIPTSNCWLKVCRLQLVECKAKCRSIWNLSETAAPMNFIKDWRSCIKSSKFRECFLKRRISKVSCVSFIKKKRFENKRRLRTFCVTKPKKGNSTHHQLLKDPLSAMYLWISVLYKVNSKNDLECIIHTWIFKKGRILFFYHRSIGYTILMKALKVSFPSIDAW